MIVDTSALFAILFKEPEREAVLLALENTMGSIAISASTQVEAHIVAQRSRISGVEAALAQLSKDYDFEIVPVSPANAQIAIEAHRIFGRGSNHPARLNFGDCFSYALAKQRGEPLLFKGDDFRKTDIEAAL